MVEINYNQIENMKSHFILPHIDDDLKKKNVNFRLNFNRSIAASNIAEGIKLGIKFKCIRTLKSLSNDGSYLKII